MIRIDFITIKEFRGIRELTLNFKGKNFAICGRNGTGKSGVVDALEFALTGSISRLSGEGSGEISLREHGPHVDFRNSPEKAQVIATVSIPSLSKTATIQRSIKTPTAAITTPNEVDVLAALQIIGAHPEIVLSRRELIDYVIASPGDRSKEVQALLRLDQVELVRASLQKISNACERELKVKDGEVKTTGENLRGRLSISTLASAKVLEATNAQRAILGLPPLPELTESTSLKDGLGTPGLTATLRIPKIQALEDLKEAKHFIEELTSPATAAIVAGIRKDLESLNSDPAVAAEVALEGFYAAGIKLIANEVCPFCDTTWDPASLRDHVQRKIAHLKEVSLKRKATEEKLDPLIGLVRKALGSFKTLSEYSANASPPLALQAMTGKAASWSSNIATLTRFVPIAESITAIDELIAIPADVAGNLSELEKVIQALPDPSKQDAAREWLVVAQERLELYRAAKQQHRVELERAQRAKKVFDVYAITSTRVLTGIYESVQEDFAKFYGIINREDEVGFTARLIPSIGKLGFNVDFYGRGHFPPGAYHSEGHQDGMGLCLYLALMRRLYGDGFTFAILDDVLMSVDAGHRREVCTLLKQEFPNTQFILTTHDQTWLRHMKAENLITGRAFALFRRWDVDQGPVEWDDRDIWTEIDDHLKKGEVRAAAALLRNFLEFVSAELCNRLRAPVEFRGDAQYQLGELLPPAVSRFRKVLGEAKAAANSWGQKETVTQIGEIESKFTDLALKTQAERWQVNVSVHYNAWENLSPIEFRPVVDSFRELLNGFQCEFCSDFLRISPERETRDSLRCDCGKTNLNLKKKSS